MRALLVHGAGGGPWEWMLWEPVLHAVGIETLALELAWNREGIAATRYLDYLAQVQAAGAGHQVLIGASLGATLVLEAAAILHPQALVVVNPLPPAPWHRLLPVRVFPAVIPWSRSATWVGTRESMPDADPRLIEEALDHWRDESGAVLADAWAGRWLPAPACPGLALISEADTELPPDAMHAAAKGLGLEVWRVPGAAHLSPLLGREAEGWARRVAEWVHAVAPRRPRPQK